MAPVPPFLRELLLVSQRGHRVGALRVLLDCAVIERQHLAKLAVLLVGFRPLASGLVHGVFSLFGLALPLVSLGSQLVNLLAVPFPLGIGLLISEFTCLALCFPLVTLGFGIERPLAPFVARGLPDFVCFAVRLTAHVIPLNHVGDLQQSLSSRPSLAVR